MREPTKVDWAYLAGLIDGDGCFTISMTQGRSRNGEATQRISISPRITIRIKANDGKHLLDLHNLFGVGKMYYHKILTPDCIHGWYILKLADCIYLTENILPYLRIKASKGKLFLEACLYWQSVSLSCPDRMKGYTHSQAQVLRIVEIACNLNYDRQTVRYRDKKGMDYWKPLIQSFYPL